MHLLSSQFHFVKLLEPYANPHQEFADIPSMLKHQKPVMKPIANPPPIVRTNGAKSVAMTSLTNTAIPAAVISLS
jgi:hypothetical protein